LSGIRLKLQKYNSLRAYLNFFPGKLVFTLDPVFTLENKLHCWFCDAKLSILTNLKSFPSNFLAFVNTTVLAGMLRPRAKVSVANKAFQNNQ